MVLSPFVAINYIVMAYCCFNPRFTLELLHYCIKGIEMVRKVTHPNNIPPFVLSMVTMRERKGKVSLRDT